MPQAQTGSTVILGACQLPQHLLKHGAAIIICTLPTFLQIRESSAATGLGF